MARVKPSDPLEGMHLVHHREPGGYPSYLLPNVVFKPRRLHRQRLQPDHIVPHAGHRHHATAFEPLHFAVPCWQRKHVRRDPASLKPNRGYQQRPRYKITPILTIASPALIQASAECRCQTPPGKAGGLMNWAASKAVVLLNRQSGMSREAEVRNALDGRTGISVSQRLYGRFAPLHKVIYINARSTLRQPT